MKKCLQCDQVYGDDTNFCLSDGSTLTSVNNSFASQAETPTVISGAPFQPTVSYQTKNAAEPKKSRTLLIAALVGFVALVVVGAVVGAVVYGVFNSKPSNASIANVANSDNRSKQNSTAEHKEDNTAENLKAQQEKLEKDRKKLEDERKALEAKKKETAPTPATSDATTAAIIDPPTNIRATPNGSIICVMRQRGTIVNILGSTGVRDNNGTWYYTDACGKQGVIHSSQIRF